MPKASPLFRPETGPQPPEPPLPGDCCNSGCDRCVYVVYQEEMDAYREGLKAWEQGRQAAGKKGKAGRKAG